MAGIRSTGESDGAPSAEERRDQTALTRERRAIGKAQVGVWTVHRLDAREAARQSPDRATL